MDARFPATYNRGVIARRPLLAALGGAIVACAARPPAASPHRARPFAFIDAMPAFFAFWERAAPESLDVQIARFRAEVVGAYPSLYTDAVLGLHGEDRDAAFRARLAAWLPTLAPIVPRMRALHASFESDMDRGVARFETVLPSFHWNGRCYLFASVDSMNGGMRKVGDRGALVFGLDVIARGGESMPAPVLFAHELFHAHQGDVLPASQGPRIYDALWAEGLATFASLVVCAWATERQALPPSHLHDPAHPALDIPARRVVLVDVMPRYARELGVELRRVLDSQNDADYAKFFLGRATPELGERPVRSGYWFGLHVARALARHRSLDALSRIPAASLRAEIGAALDAIIA